MAKWIPSPNFLPGRTTVGSVQADTHQVTGSLLITGSITLNGVPVGGGGAGTITGGDNVGSGAEVFKQVDVANLQFRTLVGSGVTINEKTTTIELTASGGGGGVTNPMTADLDCGGYSISNTIDLTASYAQLGGVHFPGGGIISGSSPVRIAGDQSFVALQVTGAVSASGGITGSYGLIGGIGIYDSGLSGSSPIFINASQGSSSCNLSLIISGSVSASCAVSASSFWKDGVELTPGGGGSPDTPLNSIQFNDASSFGGDADLTWDKTANFLALTGTLDVSGSVKATEITASTFLLDGGANGQALLVSSSFVASTVSSRIRFEDSVTGQGIGNGTSIGLSNLDFIIDNEEANGRIVFTTDSSPNYPFIIEKRSPDGTRVVRLENDIYIGDSASDVCRVSGTLDVSGSTILSGSNTFGQLSIDLHQVTGTLSVLGNPVIVGDITANSIGAQDNGGMTDFYVKGNMGGTNVLTIGGMDDDATFARDLTVSRHLIVTNQLSASAISASSYQGDGSALTDVTATATPGGVDTNLQFNSGSSFSGSARLNYDYTNNILSASGYYGDPTRVALVVGGDTDGMHNGNNGRLEIKGWNSSAMAANTPCLIYNDGAAAGANKLTLSGAAGVEILGTELVATKLSSSFISNTYFSASIGAATNASCSFYNIFNYDLTNSLTLTALNPVAGASYLFFFRQDSGGTNAVTFSGFKWPGGTAPTLSTAGNAVDIVSGISDGTYIYADTTKNFS